MDHEDKKQLKVFIPIDEDINSENGSITFIDKETSHRIYNESSNER